MKHFDLQKAIEGHPLITNHEIEIIDFHYFKNKKDEPRAVAISKNCANGHWIMDDGTAWGIPFCCAEDFKSPMRLFLKSEKKTLWIAIKKMPYDNNPIIHQTSWSRESEEDILKWIADRDESNKWQKIKIEIEV